MSLNSNLIITSLFIKNFYAVQNYRSLIYNGNQNFSVYISNLNFTKCFFTKGIIYYAPNSIQNLTFLAQYIYISEWNTYQVKVEVDEATIFGVMLPVNYIFGLSNTYGSLINITNVNVENCYSNYFLISINSTVSFSSINIENYVGQVFTINEYGTFNLEHSNFRNIDCQNNAFFTGKGGYTRIIATINNTNFTSIQGFLMYLIITNLFSDGIIVNNITCSSYFKDSGIVIWTYLFSDVFLKNIQIYNIWNAPNTIINIYYSATFLTIQNALFSNVSFIESFIFFLTYKDAIIDNATFSNMTCTRAVIAQNSGEANSLILNNSFFYNITGKNFGPFLYMDAPENTITILNTLIDGVISGQWFYLTMPLPNIVCVFHNVSFQNIVFKSGIMISVLAGQYFTCEYCWFRNISFQNAVYLNEVFQVDQAFFTLTNCFFYNISILEGEGHIIIARQSNVTIIDTIFDRIWIQGNGGLSLSNFSNLTMLRSKITNITKSEEGFIQSSDNIILVINDSYFGNIFSFKYSLMSIKNAQTFMIQNCSFYNITAYFGISVIWLTTSTNQNFDPYIIRNNSFELNSALISYGGNIVLSDCNFSIFMIDNIFKAGFALSGSFIYASNINNLQILNCSFISAMAIKEGGAMSLYGSNVTIDNCTFLNNSVRNGMGGNIYIENSDSYIHLTLFDSSQQNFLSSYLQGSCLYALFSDTSNQTYKLSIDISQIKNLKASSDVIYVKSSANILFANISNIIFSNDISYSGNGILTFYCDNVSFYNISILNSSIISGNILELNTQQDNAQILLKNFVFYNNLINNKGNFLSVSQNSYLLIDGFIFANNSFEGNFFYFQNTANSILSLENCQIANTSNIKSGNQIFAYVSNGNNLIFSSINIISSNSSLFWIDSVSLIEIKSLTANYLAGSLRNLLYISKNINCYIFDVNITNSSNSFSLIQSYNLTLNKISLLNIASSDDNFLIISSQNNVFSRASINEVSVINVNKGLIFHNIDLVNITNFVFDNSLENYVLQNSMIFQSINRIIFMDSIIKNMKNARGMQILESQNNLTLIDIINSSIISVGGDNIQQGGGIYISGYVDLNLSNSKLLNNSAVSGNALYFYSTNPLSNIYFFNNTFQRGSNISQSDLTLLIPNDTFYSHFFQLNKDLLNNRLINIASYTYEIKMFFGESVNETQNGDTFEIYSGDPINLKFLAFNHFNSTTSTSNFWQIEIIQTRTNYEMTNKRTIFVDTVAYISDMQIFVPYEQQASGLKIELNAVITKTENFGNNIFSNSFFLQLKSCDKGKMIISNKCVVCPSSTYSFEDTPTNTTMCLPCPVNAQCLNGIEIIPNIGYWNFAKTSTLIINCEYHNSCNSSILNDSSIKQCFDGYFGNVCGECVETFGKTINKQCLSCNDSYLGTHILRSVLKWVFLAFFSLFQYSLFEKILKNDDYSNFKTQYNLCNLFIFHFSIFAVIIFFHNNTDVDFTNFIETQSVFTYLENNLFLIYCIFPQVRDYKLSVAIFLYILIIPIIQFVFACLMILLIRIIILKKVINTIYDILNLFYLIFFNNFVTFIYYFIGLVFYLTVSYDPKTMVSVFFKQIIHGSGEFYIVLFCLVIFILIFMGLISFLIYRRIKSIYIKSFLGCEYGSKNIWILLFDYICFFFIILLSHYGSVSPLFAKFAKNIFMIYSGIIISFRLKKKSVSIVLFLKIFSCIVLIVSFYQVYTAIIVLNSIFALMIIGYILFLFHDTKSLKRAKSL